MIPMLQRCLLCISFLTLVFFKSSAQVNLQTGSGSFSLPIFNWQDDKSRLNSIVALSYNSGNGLRVSDIASNAGQGWNLIAGGVITRMQNGEPDDQIARGGADNDIKRYPPGILYASVPAGNGYSAAITKYPIYGSKNQLYTQQNVVAEDKQLDYFSFQFNGKVGSFVLDPSNLGTAKSVGDSKMKITFQVDNGLHSQGIRTSITSFSIHDVDGLIYKFTAKGMTKVLQTNFCDENFGNVQKQPKFKNDHIYYQTAYDVGPSSAPWVNSQMANPYVVSNWFLTEIEDALTNRKIFFNYVPRDINNTAGEDITNNKNNKDYIIISRKISIEKTLSLASIIYPDGHTATLNFGAARADLNGDYVLSSVDIMYQGRYLSKHELNTTYFIKNRYGTPNSDYQKRMARLCLKSVRKIGIDLKEDSPPYIFDYYTGSNANDDFVPPPFSYAKDIWGYYNGDKTQGYWLESIPLDAPVNHIKNSNQLRGLCYIRQSSPEAITINTKSGYAKNGLLRQIIFPTGGTLTYEYEQNTGVLNSSAFDAGGVHVSKTKSTDGGFSNGCANPVSTEYRYVNENGQSSLWGLETPQNKVITQNHYQPEYKTFKLRIGQIPTCTWKFQHPGITSQTQAISQTALRNQAIFATVMDIASILGTVNDILLFAAGETGGLSLAIYVITSIVEVALACIGDESRDSETTVRYNANLNSISPLPTQFKRVEVIEGQGTAGKTVQEFTSDSDYALWAPSNPVYSPKQRFAPWAYGLPKKTIVFDINGNKIKETENKYNFNTFYWGHCSVGPHYDRKLLLKTPISQLSAKATIKKFRSQRYTDWSNPAHHNNPNSYQLGLGTDMDVDIYNIYTGRSELDTTYERVFKPGSSTEYLETVTGYVYNDENYEPSLIKTKRSDGTFIQKNIHYSIDFVNVHGGCYLIDQPGVNFLPINTLVSNNIIGVPVETSEQILDQYGANQKYTYDKAILFTTLSNGDIKPLKILEGRLNVPDYKNSQWWNDYTNFAYSMPQPLYNPDNPDYSFFKIAQTFSYDVTGNMVGGIDEGGRTVTNIYDYDDKYIVASVINADPITDKSAYTSFETASLGKWTLTGSAAYSTLNAITGTRAFNLSSGKSFNTNGLNSARPYVVSFWSTTGSIVVSGGATLTKSAPAINGFTYYEYDVAQGTSSVTVSGTGVVDELRIYPKTARMRTTTYDPLIGKTSECDENNRISYYEYDNLGRLRFIKDENKNIVKMHEYNNVSPSKQNGCPGIYYNMFLSELYTRSNCPDGYIGDTVRFTIPANMYSSSISQADADAKAENYLLTNGQAYANANGNCFYVYYNTAVSQNYISEGCPLGQVGGTVTYTVPAGRYTSLISQQDANNKALDDIEANGDAYANSLEHRVCNINTNPDWDWPENGPTQCQTVNGVMHLFIQETDINPNSASFGTTRWTDVGPNAICGSGGTVYYNQIQSQPFTRTYCPAGYNGSTVIYTVPANTYSSTVSLAAANQLALNDIAANGPNYANTYGTCTPGECVYENCHALNEANQCIYGQCEMGIWVYVDTYYDYQLNQWVCVYHFEYSDGSWTAAFYSYGNSPCYPE